MNIVTSHAWNNSITVHLCSHNEHCNLQTFFSATGTAIDCNNLDEDTVLSQAVECFNKGHLVLSAVKVTRCSTPVH